MKGRAQTFKFGVVSSTLTFTRDLSYISSSKKNYVRVVIRPYYEKKSKYLQIRYDHASLQHQNSI